MTGERNSVYVHGQRRGLGGKANLYPEQASSAVNAALPRGKWSRAITVPPGSCLVTRGTVPHQGPSIRSLLPAGRALSLREHRPTLLGPRISPIPATTATSLMSPSGEDRVAGKEGDQEPQDGSRVHLIMKILLY